MSDPNEAVKNNLRAAVSEVALQLQRESKEGAASKSAQTKAEELKTLAEAVDSVANALADVESLEL